MITSRSTGTFVHAVRIPKQFEFVTNVACQSTKQRNEFPVIFVTKCCSLIDVNHENRSPVIWYSLCGVWTISPVWHSWVIQQQRQVSKAWIINCIPQNDAGYNYSFMPDIFASGTKILSLLDIMTEISHLVPQYHVNWNCWSFPNLGEARAYFVYLRVVNFMTNV